MEKFSEKLPDGRTLNGLISLPLKPSASINAPHLPLIVCIHGGTYTADYFHATPSTSITSISAPLSVPVIAISRPGYGGSTPLPPVSSSRNGHTFIQDAGRHLHNVILPFLWARYGPSTGSNSIVLLSHSIGSAIAIVAAALHAESRSSSAAASTATTPGSGTPLTAASLPRSAANAGGTQRPAYPLSGLITSGIGSRIRVSPESSPSDDNGGGGGGVPPMSPATAASVATAEEEMQLWPLENKDAVMLAAGVGLCPPEVLQESVRLNAEMKVAERRDIQRSWDGYWRRYAEAVTVPHLYGLGEGDTLWYVCDENVNDYVNAFKSSVRREGNVVLRAPHCIELSYAGRGWLTRCVGFGLECAVYRAFKDVDLGGLTHEELGR
ncbi:hypothetical protein EV356DRAFT_528198 [Viridothelium virens]|uniref:AB hydrolase-1 domain-containing protein n=1 Tax=Viridothelium virens TaxID=1048519 RepID=A0A6A6HNF5_VIRVR|nr:hypothetical protein EV356DRAFT_528198 [Viridothelium virens]